MSPLGRQGFATAEDAFADAMETFTDTVTLLEVTVLECCGKYGWVWPEKYADTLIANNQSIREAV